MNTIFRTIFILFSLDQFALVISVAHNQRSLRGRRNAIINPSDQSASVTTTFLDENPYETSTFVASSIKLLTSRQMPTIDTTTSNTPSSETMSNLPTYPRSVTESLSSHTTSSTSFLGFAAYPICNICREGSKLQIPDQSFDLLDNLITGSIGQEMRCDVAYYAGLSGILSPEYCLLSKRRCDCLRQELNQWPELVGVTVDEAKIRISKEFQEVKGVTFSILLDNSEDNAVSSAIMIKDRVELHVTVNEEGKEVVSSIPTCYCSKNQERGGSYDRSSFGSR